MVFVIHCILRGGAEKTDVFKPDVFPKTLYPTASLINIGLHFNPPSIRLKGSNQGGLRVRRYRGLSGSMA